MEFYETRIGARFYESTMPALVKQIERLNNNLEQMLSQNSMATPNLYSFKTTEGVRTMFSARGWAEIIADAAQHFAEYIRNKEGDTQKRLWNEWMAAFKDYMERCP